MEEPQDARPPRRRGRPKSSEQTVPVCFRVKVTVFDALFRKALRRNLTVAEFCRQRIESD
jgi:hypothetical protein